MDPVTRLRTELALQIERAHEPRDILLLIEGLASDESLRHAPDLLPLLARRVLSVCRNDTARLQEAIEFCLPSAWGKGENQDTAQPHPWGEQAEEVLLLWIQQADGITLPSAQAVLGHVARHLERASQQLAPGFTQADAACAEALRNLKERERSLEGLPGDPLRHVVRCLEPQRMGPNMDGGGVDGVRQRAGRQGRAYRSVALVNHSFYKHLLPLLQDAWGRCVAADLEHSAHSFWQAGYHENSPHEIEVRMQAHLQTQAVDRQMTVWGPSIWPRIFSHVHTALFQVLIAEALLVALFAQADRKRVVQALTAMLDEAMRLLDEESLDGAARKALQTWPCWMLTQIYRKWMAPEEEAFRQLIDAVRVRAHRLPPARRLPLLLELAALSHADAPRLHAVMELVDGLRGEAKEPTEPIDWKLIDDCLHLQRGSADVLTEGRVRAVLRYLSTQFGSGGGAALVSCLSAAVRLPGHGANKELLFAGVRHLLAHIETREGEPAPRLYRVLPSLFSGGDLLDVLNTVQEARAPEHLRALLHPPTWQNLPLWRAFVVRIALPDHARRTVSAAMAQTDDASLRSQLQALLDQLAPLNRNP